MKFIDTNGLLELQGQLFDERFIISSKSIEELENIKTSASKDADIKYKARQVVHLLDNNQDKYDVIVPSNITYDTLKDKQLPITPDNIIIACAYERDCLKHDVEFVSFDLCCKLIAKHCFGLKVLNYKSDNKSIYKGFLEKVMSEEEMAYFYEHSKENIYDLLVNQYLIIRNTEGEIVDCLKWNGEEYIPLYKKSIKSIAFGDKIKPKDFYQSMVIDSIMNNTITAISGKAGSGKSLLSLMTAMHLIETGKYDRLVVMFNPTKTRGASDLGFYSGFFYRKGNAKLYRSNSHYKIW